MQNGSRSSPCARRSSCWTIRRSGRSASSRPLPTTVADNPLAPTGFPFDTLFPFIRHFGLYHQKIAVIRNGDGALRLLRRHRHEPEPPRRRRPRLRPLPRHPCDGGGPGRRRCGDDLRAALARGGRDETATAARLPDADIGPPGTTGNDVVQVARTYRGSSTTGARLAFAPNGDRTIPTPRSTPSRARRSTSTSRTSTSRRRRNTSTRSSRGSANGEIRTLVIVLPTIGDQPFGELSQAQVDRRLQASGTDAGGPGDRPDRLPAPPLHGRPNELRAASGRLDPRRSIDPTGRRRRRRTDRARPEGARAGAAVLGRGRGRADVRVRRSAGRRTTRTAGRARAAFEVVRGQRTRPARPGEPAPKPAPSTRRAPPRPSSTSRASTSTPR